MKYLSRACVELSDLLQMYIPNCPGACQQTCNLNGVCNASTGQCECYPGYTGDHCSEGISIEPTIPCSHEPLH